MDRQGSIDAPRYIKAPGSHTKMHGCWQEWYSSSYLDPSQRTKNMSKMHKTVAANVLLLLRLAFIGAALTPPCIPITPICKAFPGGSSWPSADQWAQLNRTLEGHLLRPRLPGGVCHLGEPNFDEVLCEKVGAGGEFMQGLWGSYEWHAEDPLSMPWNNWANWTCLPDQQAPCSRDGYPAYVVNASSAKQVAIGLQFGRLLSSLCFPAWLPLHNDTACP